MIETYAIVAGALIVVGAFFGVLVIRALGARSQKAHRVPINHFDQIAVEPRPVPNAVEPRPARNAVEPLPVRNADVVIYPGSPRVAIARQPELTLAGRAAATGG